MFIAYWEDFYLIHPGNYPSSIPAWLGVKVLAAGSASTAN
jgi:hypothetical protein